MTRASIDLTALVASSTFGIVMAMLGGRYWSVVAMGLVASIVTAAGLWLANPWTPGPPRRGVGIRSMLRFGALASCNSFLVFLLENSHTILLGRFSGAQVLGVYGRAYQLATYPVEQLTWTLSNVAVAGLSAIQNDADRLSRSFLRGYSLLLTATVPIAICCPLFADEIIRVLLGDKWMEAAPIFRWLAPTSLAFALANPLSYLINAKGQIGRSVLIKLATTPVVIIGILCGLSHGPTGVAIGYSTAMALIVIPIIAWSKHGTGISWSDIWDAIKKPLGAGLLAGAAGLAVKLAFDAALPSILILAVGVGLVSGVYVAALVAMGERALFSRILG